MEVLIDGKTVKEYISQVTEPQRIAFDSQPHKVKKKFLKNQKKIQKNSPSTFAFIKESEERLRFNLDKLES